MTSLVLSSSPLGAGTIYLPNGSFESPVTSFVDTRIDSWQKSPKPSWYDQSSGSTWDQLTDLFLNPAPEGQANTNGHFTLTLQSEPGLEIEILATTNLAPAMSTWSSLGNLTNATGTAHFLDPTTNLPGRFYQARQVP